MLGYRVTLASGSIERIEADSYEVTNDASALFHGGNRTVAQLPAGTWIEIHEIGERLADSWPSPLLDQVLDTVAARLGVHYGHYVHQLRDLSRFEDWRLNEIDTLTRAIFLAIDEDPDSSDLCQELADVRQLVASGLHLVA